MFLDDLHSIERLDPQNMLAQINSLPDQLLEAWETSRSYELPAWSGIQQALIAGMGGSAVGADLLSSYVAPICTIPISILRDYHLPAWANGPQTLVIGSSHSGNTEETLQAFREALGRGCRCLAITTGGMLEQIARSAQVPVWKFQHSGQPRSAVGFSFGLLLAAFSRLHLIPDPESELFAAVEAMKQQQHELIPSIPAALNPAKRTAGQLMGRYVVVFGSGVLAPVARRWKTQINELAKAWAQFEILPEADHNTLEGILQPEGSLSNYLALFLKGKSDHPRNLLRSDLTRKSFMLAGLNTDFFDAKGESALANQWTCLHFGDYVAYYLGIAYGTDPTPVAVLQSFKTELKSMG